MQKELYLYFINYTQTTKHNGLVEILEEPDLQEKDIRVIRNR